jgi:2-polyprenyl-6-methoxyphenol hydroxylase-like FAD-dependent oxidoreductase
LRDNSPPLVYQPVVNKIHRRPQRLVAETRKTFLSLSLVSRILGSHLRIAQSRKSQAATHPEIPEFNYTDLDQHKRILERTFTGIGWRVPEFLVAVRAASDLYFDSVAHVDVADWARGRIALLGDASSCVSLFGDGSTLAIAGEYELATALAESPANPEAAFGRYQAVHGKLVASKQKYLLHAASRIVPKTPVGIWLSARLFWRTMGGLGAVMRLGRQLRRK